ncbi:MAG TPA: ATP-binding cassette domain-containing protein [Acidimicrobiales bacterium]|jgi:energy-coupling factor transport system ATP-binding protein|nr:ATP-binding cassette domain-containing protein [Acidimicrobiales bacterium]
MIRFDGVTFTYTGDVAPTLRDVDLEIPEGELCVVVGTTGSGKSTFLRAMNGLVPHATGGRLGGDVRVAGRSTRVHAPRDLADLIGLVGQDPSASFVTDAVEDELAYTMENLGVAPAAMRRRVEDTLDLLGLHELRGRPLRSLSGGQQQRVAIGAVLTAAPRALVLDEPTSALDPAAAEEVLASLSRLVHDVGLTVVIAEHRLERVLPFADRVILVPGDGAPLRIGSPEAVMVDSPVAPPLVELARVADWHPVPLSVRDARRVAAPLRARLSSAPKAPSERRAASTRGAAVATLERASFAYDEVLALSDVDLGFHAGEIVALMGRNGSGKSTLLALLAGARRPSTGSVQVRGEAPATLSPRRLVKSVGLVPQDAQLLLYRETVAEECETSDKESGLDAGTTRGVLDQLLSGVPAERHPRDLSEGQRLALALAVVLAHDPPLLLLDEPTRGLDYPSKARLEGILADLTTRGTSVVIATHDVELVARVADRAVLLADGEVVADGAAREVICHSPVFAPQVAKVLAPDPWLTVDEVRRALAGTDELVEQP